MKRLFVSACGGSGSTYFKNHVNIGIVRPDVCFGYKVNLDETPSVLAAPQWRFRAKRELVPSETINWHLMNLINGSTRDIMLSGRCSVTDMFLTRNKLKAICLVRHPLHQYVSYTSHRHPNHVKRFGGFNTAEAVRWWATRWNRIVSDFLSSGSKIIRYEYFNDDAPKDISSRIRWRSHTRNHGELDKDLESLLYTIVKPLFYRLYDSWNI